MDITIRNLAPEHWGLAVKVARQFMAEYPDSMGFHAGVIYHHPNNPDQPVVLAYRSKKTVFVRGTADAEGA